MIEFAVLGPVEARVEGGELVNIRSQQQLRVLVALFLADGQAVSVDQLADKVWLEDPPPSAIGSLRAYVNRLRGVLGPAGAAVETVTGGYRLRSDLVSSDAGRVAELLAADRATLNPSDRLRLLERAARLWRGDSYGSFAAVLWVQPEATRLDELRAEIEQRRLDVLIDLERYDEASIDATRLLVDHPYREGLRHSQTLALYRSGRQADALAALDEHRTVMVDDLGLDLSPELRALQRRMLEQDPALAHTNPQGHRLRSYRLGAVLAEGPQATVYRGAQPDIGREVTLKIFNASLANDPTFIEHFERGARRVAQLDHPHVLPVLDYWREPDRAVVVTRRTDADPLSSVAKRRPLALGEAVAAANDVIDALRFAHRSGVLHGGLTATSILLDERGRAHLTDFVLDPAPGADSAADFDDLATAFHSVLLPAIAEPFDVEFRSRLGRPTPTQVPNPYVGLGHFGEDDASVFFGRERLVADLVSRLTEETTPLLAIVGPSGAGKSSLVRAGLIPALRRVGATTGARVVSCVPGRSPIQALYEAFNSLAVRSVDAAVTHDGPVQEASAELLSGLDVGVREVTLVVDQFEEVFATGGSVREADRFFELLAALTEGQSRRVQVVLTMRSEYLDQALEHPKLATLLQTSTVAVGPMQPEELENAISSPARIHDVVIEKGLVSRLVAEMTGRPGALPLLQFTMMQLFAERDGPTVQLMAYERLGGLGGALRSHADAMAAEVTGDGDGDVLRRALLQLVWVEEGRPPTRRRVSHRELVSMAGIDDDLLAALTAGRLVMSDRDPMSREPTIEFTHEAILWSWPRLANWIDADRQLLAQQARIASAAHAWIAEDRDEGLLLTGVRLAAARELVDRRSDALSHEHLSFVLASDAADVERRDRAEVDLARERSRSRRLRLAVGLVGAALIVAVCFGLVARSASSRARAEADAARTAAIATRSLVESTDRNEIALLLALEAFARNEGVPSQQALLAALDRSPPPATVLDRGRHDSSPPTFCRSNRTPAGSFLSLGGDNVYERTDAALLDPNDGSVERVRSHLWCVAWSNTDHSILAGRGANTDLVVDATDGSVIHELERDVEVVGLVGDTLFGLTPRSAERGFAGELNSRYEVGIVRVEGDVPARLVTMDGRSGDLLTQSDIVAEHAAVSPDGSRVLTWDGRVPAGRLRGLVDAATLDTIAELGTGEVSVAGWSQDGSVVTIVAPSGALEMRDRNGVLLAAGTVSIPRGTQQLAHDPGTGALALLGRSEVRIFRQGRPFVEVASFRVNDAPQGVGWVDDGQLAVVERSGLVRVYDVFADYGARRTLTCCESGGPPQLLHGRYGTDGERLIDLMQGNQIDPAEFGGIVKPDSLLLASLPDGRILTTVDAPFPPELGLYDPATGETTVGRPFEYEQLVRADALIALPTDRPEIIAVGLVEEFAGGVTAIDLVEVDARTMDTSDEPTRLSMSASYFWNREPTIWQAGLGRFEQWNHSASLRSEPIEYSDQFLRGGLSPNGRWLLLIDRRSQAVAFDTTTGERVGTLPLQVDLTDPVVLDDGRAVVRELDGSLALWDLASRQRIGSIGVAGGPSGSRLLGSVDGSGVWYASAEGFVFASLDVNDWQAAACQLVTHDLSADEWHELVGDGEPVSRCPGT